MIAGAVAGDEVDGGKAVASSCGDTYRPACDLLEEAIVLEGVVIIVVVVVIELLYVLAVVQGECSETARRRTRKDELFPRDIKDDEEESSELDSESLTAIVQ